eukprot:345658-Pleurochrysis_carterae.AAC.1
MAPALTFPWRQQGLKEPQECTKCLPLIQPRGVPPSAAAAPPSTPSPAPPASERRGEVACGRPKVAVRSSACASISDGIMCGAPNPSAALADSVSSSRGRPRVQPETHKATKIGTCGNANMAGM